jgi:hypothetical protein
LENVDIHFMTTWNILRALVIFYDHLVQCLFIWSIFLRFWNDTPKKSGNPGTTPSDQSTDQSLCNCVTWCRTTRLDKKSCSMYTDLYLQSKIEHFEVNTFFFKSTVMGATTIRLLNFRLLLT